MKTNRRGFLEALAALPVVGWMFGKVEAPYEPPTLFGKPIVMGTWDVPIGPTRIYFYNEKTGEQTEIKPMSADELRAWRERERERRMAYDLGRTWVNVSGDGRVR